ncbi:hypothetical protein OJF2_52340 [Aquisphaera giovannonii]|uniref:Glycosyltransferase RgtA/B/C/D-like domain-containing protein n=1 Tax=Aquisphaera giovannonii TaxID=406548 RepID=A0A5B9W8Y5_9BACT|nr:hypothetical protein [Aquisphaera giovannonii]QEH36649.1 hypothetical protein OJF2_52340 [Aquisphaera giovannonii]
MQDPEECKTPSRAGLVAKMFLFAMFVAVTMPSWIQGISRGIDGSWIVGLSLAEARGLVHGRDIAFTFGPLGFALVPTAHAGSSDHALPIRLAIFGLWCGSTGLLFFRVRGRFAPLVFLLAASLNGLPIPGGPSTTLIGMLTLAVLNFLILAELERRPGWAIPAAMLAGAAILTKFSTGVGCASALGIWSLIRIWREPTRQTARSLALLSLAYVGTMAVLFVAYGGPLSALPAYLRLSRELASGYSTQMVSSDVAYSPLVPAALVALTVLGLAVSARRRSALAPVFAIMLLPMFALYKGAIVRLDMGHFQLHWPTMFSLFALLMPVASQRPRLRLVTTLGVALLLAWTLRYPTVSREGLAAIPANWGSLIRFRETKTAFRAGQEKVRAELWLPERLRSQIGQEPVDVYPWEVMVAWANRLNWRPRPVFQAYASYTPILDELGAELYRDPARAPRYILYTYAAIDQELPSLVDSRTWAEMYRWYDCVDEAGDFLLLRRRPSPRWTGERLLLSATQAMKERLEIPEAPGGLTFLEADFELTLWGRLMAFLYRVEPPRVKLEFKDGSRSIHRTVWRNAGEGFLIGNVPRGQASVRTLFETGKGDECSAVTFRDISGWNFKKSFRVRLVHSPMKPDGGVARFAAGTARKAVR